MDTIVVTGATGHIGGGIVRRLLARGTKVRAIARNAGRLAQLEAKGAEVRAGDLADAAFLTDALRGSSAAFLMAPPPAPDDRDPLGTLRRVIREITSALRGAGVPRAVALSSIGAEVPAGTGPIQALHELERELSGLRGLAVLILRPAYFMENHLMSIPMIRAMGFAASAVDPELPFPQIATRDIADVAAEALTNASLSAEVRYLLGPRDVTMAEATRVLGASVGKPDLVYRAVPYTDFVGALTQAGLSPEIAGLYAEMQKAMNERVVKAEERTPGNTTPTTLEEFARDVFAPAYAASA